MIEMREDEYNRIHSDFRGVWSNPDRPELVGKRTLLHNAGSVGTVLLIEGESLIIECDEITIEMFDEVEYGKRYTGARVHLHTVYEESSVLHGQPVKRHLDTFDTLELAKQEYPNATVYEVDEPRPVKPVARMSDVPEAWFDPANAGEEW